MYLEIAIVLVLTVINGLLAMSELAVVSARPARLRIMADRGSAGARKALRLAEDPGRFFSTVQIGITLVGVLSGAFSGATLGARLSGWLEQQGLSAAMSDGFGVGSVVVLITYLSLIVGELVPKQIALRNPEAIAARVAPAMLLLSRFAAPLVWLLDNSGKVVLKLLGSSAVSDERMTDEEVKTIIAEAESAGVIESEERDMISGVMRLADRTAKALMTPRREVEVIDLDEDVADILTQVGQTRFTRLPVQDGDADSIIGIVVVKDLLNAIISKTSAPDIRAFLRKAPVVTDNSRALDVLKAIRAAQVHMALVFDEYGHFEGVITSGDVLEAITGVFEDEDEPAIVTRADGSFLVSGWMPIDEFSERIGLPLSRAGDYETVAGFILNTLNRLPEVGETFSEKGWLFEIVDLDGRRIDKVIVCKDG